MGTDSDVYRYSRISCILSDSCNLASMKNSLVHVISKLHSKPFYYLYLKNRFVAELYLDFSLSPLMKGQKQVGNFHRLSSAAQ